MFAIIYIKSLRILKLTYSLYSRFCVRRRTISEGDVNSKAGISPALSAHVYSRLPIVAFDGQIAGRTNGVDMLKEIPVDDLPLLLDDLKSDFPNSTHAWAFIKTIHRWNTADPAIEVKMLALDGDFRKKFIVYYVSISDNSDVRGSMHKWSHRDDDDEVVRDALRTTQLFPWDAKTVLLTAMTSETDQAVLPVLGEQWEEGIWRHEPGHLVYWVPKEEAEKLTVSIPDGTYLSRLTPAHAKEINDIWPHRYKGSEQFIAETIKLNFGVGLFDSSTHELMCWALFKFYGGSGALQTKERHKKKGYGGVVLKAITKEIAGEGYDVHCNIVRGNVASVSLLDKVNYHFAFNSNWVVKGEKR